MADNTLLDEYVTLGQEYIESGGLHRDEFYGKFDIVLNIKKARAAVLARADDWTDVVKQAYKYRPGDRRFDFGRANALTSWIDREPSNALDALQALWAEDNTPIPDRIRKFVPRPKPARKWKNGYGGTGTRLGLIAALLMALDPGKYPPYWVKASSDAYKRTGYCTPPKKPDEVALYEHALKFLDKLVERAAALGLAGPSNRLEAQSIVWLHWYEEDGYRRRRPLR